MRLPTSVALVFSTIWALSGCTGGDAPTGGTDRSGEAPDGDTGTPPAAQISGPGVVGTDAGDAGAVGTEAGAAAETGARPIAKPVLQAKGSFFTDPTGRAVLLRGVNVSGTAKTPPFAPFTDTSKLDRLNEWGMNVIRLVFVWEAYEPTRGFYDESYLDRISGIARAAWERGIFVIVDIHQDGFARTLAGGCGDGFPFWAVSSSAWTHTPDNGPGCSHWAILMATDIGMHASFGEFYADTNGVRTSYLQMLEHIGQTFATIPGVIGYDPINEPWGYEDTELGPFERDAAAALRRSDPTAIMFLEGHVTTNSGSQTSLPPPSFDNVAYAPHFYDSIAVVENSWGGSTSRIDTAFANMTAKAHDWNVPLFVGEYGLGATAPGAGAYVNVIHHRMDDGFVSGAQWNFTPDWNDEAKDGWNGEDFSIVDDVGGTRENFERRPVARAVAGTPMLFDVQEHTATSKGSVVLVWNHRADLGETEVVYPRSLFGNPKSPSIEVNGEGLGCAFDPNGTVVRCRSAVNGTMRVTLTEGD